MESFENIKKYWEKNTGEEIGFIPISRQSFEEVIRKKISKEQRNVIAYFWASFVFQVVTYAFLSHLFIKYWGNDFIMLWSLAGIIFYVPFTFMLLHKIKCMKMMTAEKLNSSLPDIASNIKNQYRVLFSFFRFKKFFELFLIPAICFVFIVLVFKLYVPGGAEANLAGFVIAYIIIVSIFCLAVYAENKKRFKGPLRQLQLILEDLGENNEI
ncbi:MAG: hypothetical protein ABIR15_05025 [Chitinophagaceae bacterium]